MHRTAWDYLASSWCWRILSRIPWRARRSNQSILKEINVFIGRTDTEAQAPILWSPDAKNWLIGKDPDAGKDWGQEEKGTTEDKVVGWHHRLNGHEFEQSQGDSKGQGGLACCSPFAQKVKHDLATAQQQQQGGRPRIWIHLLSSKPMFPITKFVLHVCFVNQKGFFISSCVSHRYTWSWKKKHSFNFSIISILWMSW